MNILTGAILGAVLCACAPQDTIEKGKIRWSTDHDASVAKGKKEGKILIVYFWAPG